MADGFAPAKINLALHVTGRRDDGYHLLDSLVCFADLGDHLRAAPAGALSLRVAGPMAEGVPTDAGNLVLRAARALGVTGAALELEKHLPAAAGIGGGSSDAAAALRVLAAMTGRPLPADAGLSLGADVPVCLSPRPARMRGIGERLDRLALPALPAVLVNPGFALPTPAIFKALARRENPPMPELPEFPDAAALTDWLQHQRNDLEPAALAVDARVGGVLAALRDTPARLVRMSGSGATCFGLYDSEGAAEAAANTLCAARPGWWVRKTVLNPAA
jgi:4-diphosphocytidyl-2-C-methyl-D-erythritol kinase